LALLSQSDASGLSRSINDKLALETDKAAVLKNREYQGITGKIREISSEGLPAQEISNG
jgi:hypothetical protein